MALRKLTQAVILAGGSGERLRPFTLGLPKPLVSVHGKPFICYLIDRLKSQGINEILVLAGYMAQEFNVLNDIYDKSGSLNIKILATSPDFQTGNRVLLASDEIADEFILLYGDNYWPFDFDILHQKFLDGGRTGQIVIYENTDYYSSSNICVDANSRVTLYDTSRKSPQATYVDLGFGIYKKEVLSYLDLKKNLSFEKQVYNALIDRGELGAVSTRHRYYTLTNIERMGPLIHVLSDQKSIFLTEDLICDRGILLSGAGLSLNRIWKPGALEFINRCKGANANIFLLSFWPEISNGLISQPKVDSLHRELKQKISDKDTDVIKHVYVCPHGREEKCGCAHGEIGLFIRAQRDYHLDLSKSYFVVYKKDEFPTLGEVGVNLIECRTNGLSNIAKKIGI